MSALSGLNARVYANYRVQSASGHPGRLDLPNYYNHDGAARNANYKVFGR